MKDINTQMAKITQVVDKLAYNFDEGFKKQQSSIMQEFKTFTD